MGALDFITSNTGGATSTVRYLANLLSNYSQYPPRVDFFPSSIEEMDRLVSRFADKEIPGIREHLCEGNGKLDLNSPGETSEDLLVNQVVDNNTPTYICDSCKDEEPYEKLTPTAQAELRRFLQHQEAGLDTSFRCRKCRDCRQCLRGAGQERMSMKQEAEQLLIRESVRIDWKFGRAIATLPFITDPTDKLVDNTYIAEKRLENVCKKYSSDEKVKEMLNKSMKKLTDKGQTPKKVNYECTLLLYHTS